MATTPTVEVLTVSMRDAAKALSVSERHLRTLAHAGEIPTVQLRGRTVVPVRWIHDQVDGAIRTWEQRQGSAA